MMVPDLQNGFMILNHDAPNRWLTGIECVLARRESPGAEEQRAYLSQECRAEQVCDDPFSHAGEYEYVGISTWSGNYALRSGSSITGVKSPEKADEGGPDLSHEKVDRNFVVSCSDRQARQVSYEEVQRLLQSDFEDGYMRLYMAISFRQRGHAYVLYAPCRYINFPNPRSAAGDYLQPISGYVLYEREDRFAVAYVVCHIAEGRTRALQFKLRPRTSYDFCETERIDDDAMECVFFSYP